MEGEGDNFLKALQKKQRALVKKLDRIKKKQAEVKSSGKEVKEDEKKLIESEPLIQELLQETEKTVQSYKQHLESAPKPDKKPVVKEEDRSIEVVSLWLLGEFLSILQVKEKFVRENPEEVQDLDAFLLLHSQSKGQIGKKFGEILTEAEKTFELFLGKSDKVAPGTLRTYKKLSEFKAKALVWASGVPRPQSPPKVQVEHAAVEHRVVAEEVKVETREEKDLKPEPVPEVKQSTWANDDEEEDEWEEHKNSEQKEVAKSNPEDDGFITVTARKPKTNRNEEKDYTSGERRGRGRRGGRGRGRGKWEGEEREEFRGERRRGGRRGRGRDRADGGKEEENRE